MTLDYLHLLSFVIALHLTTYRTGLAGHTGLKISNTTPFNLLPSPFFFGVYNKSQKQNYLLDRPDGLLSICSDELTNCPNDLLICPDGLINRSDKLINRPDDLLICPDDLLIRPDDLLYYAPCPLGGSVGV